MTSSPVVHGATRHTTSIAAASHASSSSIAGWVLAALPATYGLSLVLPVAGVEWNPIEYAIIGVAFYLASVALAAVDERHLRGDGVERAATAYWSLLTVMPYLVARTRVLVDSDRAGLAVLWTAIIATTVSALGLLLVATS
jgi:hypothetical protein